MLHPKQGVAGDTRATEVLYGVAAETTVPAVRSGVRCQHNARSASLRGCRADGNDSLDSHPRRRARRSPPLLAADVSGSMDKSKFELQRSGYAAAFSNPRVIEALRGGPRGRVAAAFIEWSGVLQQKVV